jgi:FixJ family two-component response regulator
MSFIGQDMEEFCTEATELLVSAEKALIAIDKGESIEKYYEAIFKVFYSVKGGATMMGIDSLQKQMTVLESMFAGLRGKKDVPSEAFSILLKSIEGARFTLTTTSNDARLKKTTPTAEAADAPEPQEKTEQNLKSEVIKNSNVNLTALSDLKPLIYAIDDEQDILDIIQFELEQVGMECVTFIDPNELYKAFKRNQPDLVLTDMKMPGCSGQEVLQAIRKLDPDVPVIFISGFLDKENLMEALEFGVFAAIEKPFNEKTLLNHVKNALKQRQMTKYLNRSINLILYQFSDIDAVLAEHGKDDIRRTIRAELSQLILFRRELREFKQK